MSFLATNQRAKCSDGYIHYTVKCWEQTPKPATDENHKAIFQPRTQLVPVLAMSSFSVYETCLLAVKGQCDLSHRHMIVVVGWLDFFESVPCHKEMLINLIYPFSTVIYRTRYVALKGVHFSPYVFIKQSTLALINTTCQGSRLLSAYNLSPVVFISVIRRSFEFYKVKKLNAVAEVCCVNNCNMQFWPKEIVAGHKGTIKWLHTQEATS